MNAPSRERLQDDQSRDQANWQAYRVRLYHFVQSRVGDEQAAEDMVHDALVRAYTQWGAVRDRRKVQSWLYQITRNAIVDYFRARKVSEALPEAVAEEGPSDEAERALAQCLTPLVQQLPERYREAVQFSELEGMKQRDVAARLGLSVSGAKSRIQRGRKKLEDLLLACCRVEHDSRGRIMDYEPRKPCFEAEESCGESVSQTPCA